MDMGYLNSALVDFDKAIKLNPEVTEFYINRVNILLKKDLYSKALSDFDKIISLEPKSNIWFLRRGLLKIKHFNSLEKKIKKLVTIERPNCPFLVLSFLKFVFKNLISNASFNTFDSKNCCILNSGPE